ncbi:Membrane lipoprotein TpN32 precursor [Dickeya solani]|nr:Membrane lipoprotein TpN32 precursor [Dickeya solani]
MITIKPNIDPTKASEKDIQDNPRELVFKSLEAAQLPRTLDSVTASLVNGNFAIAAGLKLSSALKLETLDENLKNVIAVRTDDLDKPFVKEIKAAVESPAYAAVINDPTTMFSQQAAKEIETLIGESVSRVSTGSELVREAGSAMEVIISSVSRYTT